MDLNGKVIRIKAEGLLAQALEHETDHLNGHLYIDRLVSRETLWKVTYNSEGKLEYQQANSRANSRADSEEAANRPDDPPTESGETRDQS